MARLSFVTQVQARQSTLPCVKALSLDPAHKQIHWSRKGCARFGVSLTFKPRLLKGCAKSCLSRRGTQLLVNHLPADLRRFSAAYPEVHGVS